MKEHDDDEEFLPDEDLEGLAPDDDGLDALIDEDEDGGDDDEDEDEDGGEEEEEDGGDGDEGGEEAAPKKSRKAAAAEKEEAPGPDVPAPPLKTLRKALEWAFENENDAPPELLDRFAEHAHMLLEYNRKVNLTALLDPKEVAAQHYLDSWRLSQCFSLLGRRVLDLGTGGGFPGIPLALTEPNASFVLVDSTKKKVDFLEQAIEKLGLKNATAHWGRAEEYLAKERVDVVLVRAVSSVRENVRTLRKVRHSLKDLVMYKGPSWSREVRAGEREAERLGFHMDTVWEYELPGDMGQRAILIYRAPGGHGL